MNERPVIMVTGGSSGLGKAVTERFAHKGFPVAVVDISAQNGKCLEASFLEQGKTVRFYEADVTDQETAKKVASDVAKDFGRIDYLVNAAGIIRRSPSIHVSEDEIGAVIDTNLIGTVFMCQAVQPFMIEAGGGAIVNFGSMLAHYGSKNLLSYAASKGGVVQVTKCLAVDWAEYNIRVNAVSPGYIETPLSSGATKDSVFRERILSRTPQRRFGTPDEVASVIDFLCSQDASFITGVDLPVDGGLLAGDPVLFPPMSSYEKDKITVGGKTDGTNT
ncbi:3-oxoacyl-[acyl-carrier protein] reductase [Fictibacillus enclensis]|uniref:Gluconate 5-dehydrogenase n=1 Tax=Fictibacillus enclensis TaxID=1017270 RepID=A0A0V8JFP7_9BACL|nr:SDR family oxidoreductase [Fictibacillus enclensis]KSU85871.1 gluconate 5-dehydrogenase [Fictibacillus enclensis]SCC04263.1 3-oxoacyl-[acyl-carrier protein] reductase [Fictibacillus enclensis]